MNATLAALLDLFSRKTHWIVPSIIGALIGLVLPVLVKGAVSLVGRFKGHYMKGLWHHYYVNYDTTSAKCCHELVRVRSGIRNRFSIVCFEPDSKATLAKGMMEYEKDFVILTVRSLRHEETAFIRLQLRIPTDSFILVGVSLAQDGNGLASVGMNVFSKTVLSEEDVLQVISERALLDSTCRVIRVKKS